MKFGLIIDNDYLRQLPEYKDKQYWQISSADRGRVAMRERDKYEGDAVNRSYLLKVESNVGSVGASVECRVYNASGDRLQVHLTKSWGGDFYQDQPDHYLENGQWSAFVHYNDGWSGISSATGAVVYRTSSDADIFIGWHTKRDEENSPSCHAESREKDHWWNVGSEGYMESRITKACKLRSRDTQQGYKVTTIIGQSCTSACVTIIEKA
ncbi:hypothetical protein LshimejAT787_1400590 [Lyophyllum shimeji]|uniref:Uncharacterized protein n=1 Tax=Lyophyllum shimeji TaxID=47721 RepID=A0A9P3PYG2_LYOSH|nr:hypothetical protein LshimejAT787_1400590 [Lyophyllum shimeji]